MCHKTKKQKLHKIIKPNLAITVIYLRLLPKNVAACIAIEINLHELVDVEYYVLGQPNYGPWTDDIDFV